MEEFTSHRVEITDCNGAQFALFVSLPAETYFGGLRAPEHDREAGAAAGLYGAHQWLSRAGLLDVIGKLAQVPRRPGLTGGPCAYSLQGGPRGYYLTLGQNMGAQELAQIFDCDPVVIVDHFRLLVRVYETESEAAASG